MISEEQKIYDLKLKVAPLFNSKCFVCEMPIRAKKPTFQIHHIKYIFNDVVYKDFKKPNGRPDTLSYHKKLIPLVEENPTRFALLCHPHHQALERLKRYKQDKLLRLVLLVLKSSDTKNDELIKLLELAIE